MSIYSLATQVLAQAEGQPGGGALGAILPLGLMFLVVYFLLIRPANKQRREHSDLLNALKKDDEIVTTGGIYGKIVNIEDKVATLEISDKVRIKVLRERIAGRWEPNQSSAQK